MNGPAAVRTPTDGRSGASFDTNTTTGADAARVREKRRLVLALAALTMAVEVAGLAFLPTIDIGTMALSPSLIPALWLALALGPARRSTVRYEAVLPFWCAIVAGLATGAVLFWQAGDAVDVLPLLAAAADEEIVYRLAVPMVIAVALTFLKVPARRARVVGYLVAGAWWVLLPGHQVQTTTLAVFGSYAAFAALSAVVVARSRALVAMSAAHAVLNLITISQSRGEIGPGARGVLVACLLLMLVGTFARPGLRRRPFPTAVTTAPEQGVDTIIDLRDGFIPSESTDGETALTDEDRHDADEPAATDARRR